MWQVLRSYSGAIDHLITLNHTICTSGKSNLKRQSPEFQQFLQTSERAKSKLKATMNHTGKKNEAKAKEAEAMLLPAARTQLVPIQCYDCGSIVHLVPGQVVCCPTCLKPNQLKQRK
jgi:hypothetical protein